MSSQSVKVLSKKKLSSFEYRVELKYKGKVYGNNFSLPGLKVQLKEIQDKKSLQYIITKAMVDAVDKKSVKTEGEQNVDSEDN